MQQAVSSSSRGWRQRKRKQTSCGKHGKEINARARAMQKKLVFDFESKPLFIISSRNCVWYRECAVRMLAIWLNGFVCLECLWAAAKSGMFVVGIQYSYQELCGIWHHMAKTNYARWNTYRNLDTIFMHKNDIWPTVWLLVASCHSRLAFATFQIMQHNIRSAKTNRQIHITLQPVQFCL